MSRSVRGGKAQWEAFGGKRLGNEGYHGYPSFGGGKVQKRATHKAERKEWQGEPLALLIEDPLKEEFAPDCNDNENPCNKCRQCL